MQYTNEELILAANIRSIAYDLREKAAVQYASLNHGGSLAARDEFKATHPVVGFFDAAMTELKDITDTVIRR